MSDLISRQAAIDAIDKAVFKDVAIDAVRHISPADVVEVVRCKDCRKWITVLDREKASYGLCEGQPQGLATRNKNDFCSYGERADGDEL